MLTVSVIHVGDFKEKFFALAESEYKKRISAFAKFEDICLKEAILPENPNEKEIERALSAEAKEILARLDPRAKKIALCVEGKEKSSEELAEIIKTSADSGISRIIFIIGSSHGLSEEVKEAVDLKLSFSKMTFPHQLMRVILAEQIYRAFTINAKGKYHK